MVPTFRRSNMRKQCGAVPFWTPLFWTMLKFTFTPRCFITSKDPKWLEAMLWAMVCWPRCTPNFFLTDFQNQTWQGFCELLAPSKGTAWDTKRYCISALNTAMSNQSFWSWLCTTTYDYRPLEGHWISHSGAAKADTGAVNKFHLSQFFPFAMPLGAP